MSLSPEHLPLMNAKMYENLDFLVTFGLSEQNRINAMNASDEDKKTAMKDLIYQLDTTAAYQQHEVRVRGERVIAVPVLEEDASVLGIGEEGGLNFVGKYELTPDVVGGVSYGFDAKKIAVEVDGFNFGDRWLLCHLVSTGESSSEMNDNGNIATERTMATFPVESSTLLFTQDAFVHDIRRLKQKLDPLYEDIDIAMHKEDVSVAQTLKGIRTALRKHKFNALEDAEREEVVSYLNSCDVLPPAQLFTAEYGIMQDDNEDYQLIAFTDHFKLAALNKFIVVQGYEIHETPTQFVTIYRGETIGIEAEIFEPDRRYKVIVPLNQPIKLHQPSTEVSE